MLILSKRRSFFYNKFCIMFFSFLHLNKIGYTKLVHPYTRLTIEIELLFIPALKYLLRPTSQSAPFPAHPRALPALPQPDEHPPADA